MLRITEKKEKGNEVVCVLKGNIKTKVIHQPGRSNSHVRVMPELLMLTITKHLQRHC